MAAGKLQLISLVGLALSGYAMYVEYQSEQNPSYKAMCDLNSRVSCSKVSYEKLIVLVSLKDALLQASMTTLTSALSSKQYLVFLSDWGRLFSRIGILPAGHPLDLPNAAFGLIYFTIVLLHPYLPLGNYKVSSASMKCKHVIYSTALSKSPASSLMRSLEYHALLQEAGRKISPLLTMCKQLTLPHFALCCAVLWTQTKAKALFYLTVPVIGATVLLAAAAELQSSLQLSDQEESRINTYKLLALLASSSL
eukprot:9282-Heterococcus_DN1.PRE.2